MALWTEPELAWLLFYSMLYVPPSKTAILLSRRFSASRSMDDVAKRFREIKSAHDLINEEGLSDPVKIRVYLEFFMEEHQLLEPNLDAGLSESEPEIVNSE